MGSKENSENGDGEVGWMWEKNKNVLLVSLFEWGDFNGEVYISIKLAMITYLY